MRKSVEVLMSLYFKETLLHIIQGDRESAERLIEYCVEKNECEIKEVYSYLLCIAACYGEVKVAEFYRDKGADLDYEDPCKRTPLWLAMRCEKKEMEQALRKWGACKDTHHIFGKASEIHSKAYIIGGCSVSYLDGRHTLDREHMYDWKKVFIYIKQDDRESAEKVIEDFIEKNQWRSDEVYKYLLIVAACYGEVEVAKFCKEKGVNLDCKDLHDRTPLWLAIKFQKKEMEQALIEWGAREDIHCVLGKPFLVKKEEVPFYHNLTYDGLEDKMPLYCKEIFLYIKQGNRENAERIIGDLIEKNKWEPKDVYGYLLCVAAGHSEIEAAEFCKDKVDLDCKDQYGRTPLQLAIKCGQEKMKQTLEEWIAIEIGEKMLLSIEMKFEGIKQSIRQGSRESVAEKLDRCSKVIRCNPEKPYGYLLCVAARYGEIEVAEFCRSKGVNLDYKDHNGDTPLAYALQAGQKQMAETLRGWRAHKGTHEISSEVQSFSIQEAQKMDKKTCRLM